jgi:hypothetical protein
LGHCVLNGFLVVFTVSNNTSYIYRVQEVDGELTKIILYSGEGLLDEDYPVKCLGFYETDIL